MTVSLNPLGPGAAEIIGLDCRHDFDAQAFAAIKNTFNEFPVLVFRDQDMSPAQLAGFGRKFGRLERYEGNGNAANGKNIAALQEIRARETPDQMLYQSPEDRDVLIMTNERREGLPVIGIVDNAEMWHSDASHKNEPCQAIMVHVQRNPADGGDTEFCDLRAIYDALTPEIKALLGGRHAMHHWSKSINPRFAGTLDMRAMEEGERIAKMIPPQRQPVIRTHPDTARQSLYLSPRFTLELEDMDKRQSDSVLNSLFAFMDEPQFIYRHVWREKDLMIWDNRCTNHRVRSYAANDIRRRHRVAVAGDKPFYRAA
jgi:taurine dioxygenase